MHITQPLHHLVEVVKGLFLGEGFLHLLEISTLAELHYDDDPLLILKMLNQFDYVGMVQSGVYLYFLLDVAHGVDLLDKLPTHFFHGVILLCPLLSNHHHLAVAPLTNRSAVGQNINVALGTLETL